MSYRKVQISDNNREIELLKDMSAVVTKSGDNEESHPSELEDGEEKQINANIDDILSQFEVSYFHYRLLVLCGLAFMNDAMEVLLLTFLSACAGAEFNLNETDIATLVSIVFVGEVLGTILWGPIADVYGRRVAYLWICLFITVFGFMSGMAPDYGSLVTIRFGVGIGVGGAPVPFDLLAEFLPAQSRGSFLLLIEIFWCIGSMFVVSMASVIIPTHGWRALVFVTAIPATLACVWSYVYLPESPRWLIEKGSYKEAEKVVTNAAEVNGTTLPPFTFGPGSLYKKSGSIASAPRSSGRTESQSSRFQAENPIHSGEMRNKSVESDVKLYTNASSDSPSLGSTHMPRPQLETWSDTLYYYTIYAMLVYINDIQGLFATKEMRAVSIPITFIWLIFGFTYYGVILFITRIYETTSHGSAECTFDYDALLINSSSEFLGLLVAIALIDWFGRVQSQALFYGVGGLSLAILGGIHGMLNPTSVLFLSLFTRASAMGASCVTWVATPELFKTQIRATAHSFVNLAARFGALASPYFVISSISPVVVAIVMGACNFVAVGCALCLKETKGKSLEGDDE